MPPRNKRELASWLGLANYYRKFSPNHSKICLPLTKLLSKEAVFKWEQDQQDAFDIVKARLTSYPTLRRPDMDRPFIVHTDASTQAIGAILAQKDDDGREYVVAYHSKKLTPAQQKWPIAELECYAVYHAVCEAFSDFLYGAENFQLFTDCICLKWLFSAKNLKPRLQRYVWALSEYPGMNIVHRMGTAHRNVDALTRDPTFCVEDEGSKHPQDEEEDLVQLNALIAPFEETSMEPNGVDVHLAMDLQAMAITQAPEGSGSSDTPPPILRWLGQTRRVCIEGNIGSGKSTVISYLAQHLPCPDWHVMAEPVHAWQPLLSPFYGAAANDPLKPYVAALLQITVLTAYANEGPDRYSTSQAVLERGPWSCLEVFLKVQDLPEHLKKLIQDVSSYLYPSLMHSQPDALIYLDCPPATCLERTQQRQHEGESNITLEYLTTLDEHYKAAIEEYTGTVIHVDATQDAAVVAQQVLQAIESIAVTTQGPHSPSPNDEHLCMMGAVQVGSQPTPSTPAPPRHPILPTWTPRIPLRTPQCHCTWFMMPAWNFQCSSKMALAVSLTLRPSVQSIYDDLQHHQSPMTD